MAIQLSVEVRNAMLDAIETTVGATAKLQIRTGAAPANTAAADTGTLLVEFTLPADWAAAASGGSKSWSGVPVNGTAVAAGTAAHFRLKNNAGTLCHEQGTVTATGGGGDATIDNTVIANGQTVNLTAWTWQMPGA